MVTKVAAQVEGRPFRTDGPMEQVPPEGRVDEKVAEGPDVPEHPP